ncbi:alpha-galactosidase [Lachnospiraceae bacterium ZAX-1]
MKKIVFIGAGSLVFTRNLARDILTFSALSEVHFALVDTNAEKLPLVQAVLEKLIQEGKYKATVSSTIDRREALKNADGVLITISTGDYWNCIHTDLEIPMKYGVDLCVGDTRGPGGIFRMLRTLPALLDICRDIEELAPRSIVLNYTNPMAMLCRALQEKTNLKVTGLCHSVQHTAQMLAKWIGAPLDEISYICAGINHQAHYLDFRWKGEDAYPLIRRVIESDSAIYKEEQVRNEMFLRLDYYVTESSGHASEYNAWFRKRKDLLEEYCTHGTGWNPGLHEMGTDFSKGNSWREEFAKSLNSDKIDLKRGEEYAAYIFNACFGDKTPYMFHGNTRNFGLIDNLPVGSCVEVPMLAGTEGIRPIRVGALPPQLAALNTLNAMCEDMAVQGFFCKNRRMIYHAICLDPLTSAVLSLREIERMTDEMFEANKTYLSEAFYQ